MIYILELVLLILLGHLVPVLTEECPELRLIEKRESMYGTLREGTSFERLIIDERDSRKIVIETLRLYQGDDQFIKYDVYELPGEDRQFYVIHFYKWRWVNGYLDDYSLGQLTTDLDVSGTIAKSLDKPLQTVSMCDDNIFELVRTRTYFKFSHWAVFRFRLLKHYSDGRIDVLCGGGKRFLQLRLTPYGCLRDIWEFGD